MPSEELLGACLNDHLAGAAAGVELAEKLAATGSEHLTRLLETETLSLGIEGKAAAFTSPDTP